MTFESNHNRLDTSTGEDWVRMYPRGQREKSNGGNSVPGRTSPVKRIPSLLATRFEGQTL